MIAILLILLNIILYTRTVNYPGICDDVPVFNQQVEIPEWKYFPKWWSYFWYHLHGRKYLEWRLPRIQVIGIHTINCILIYYAFGHNTISAMAAFLFAVNPVNNQCSIWLSGKGYAINTTCALLMWMFPLFSPVFYLFGTYFCGASLLLFPLIFLFTKYWWLSFLVIWGWYREKDRIFNKKNPTSKFNTESNPELLSVHRRKFVLMFKSYGYHLINSVSARILGLYHKYLFLMGVNKDENKKAYKLDLYFYFGIFAVLYILIFRHIGLLWFSISIAMWCNLISFNQTLANRYDYLPNVGYMYFIACVLALYPALAGLLFVYYLSKLVFFIKAYDGEYWSIEYSLFEQPDFFYSWQNRAAHCFLNRNYHGALGNTLKAMELRKNDWKLTYNLAQIYLVLGHLPLARKTYEDALKFNIDGRETQIKALMDRLGKWIDEIEKQAKENGNKVDIDLLKFDMQR